MAAAKPKPVELEVKILSMNLSGRFAARELKVYGQRAVQYLLEKEKAGLLFGHSANFKLAPLEDYEFVGTNKAFFLFNTELLRGGEDKQFKQLVRNLQFRGKLTHNYLQESSFAVCKFRARHDPFLQFIAISWPSEEIEGRLKSRNNFKHMVKFAADLAYLEQLPVVIGGTSVCKPSELKSCLPEEFEYLGYHPANARRETRASEFYILSTSGIRLTEVRPIICGKIDLNKDSSTWRSPEDFFYYDPIKAVLWLEKIKSWGSSLSLLSNKTTDIPADQSHYDINKPDEHFSTGDEVDTTGIMEIKSQGNDRSFGMNNLKIASNGGIPSASSEDVVIKVDSTVNQNASDQEKAKRDIDVVDDAHYTWRSMLCNIS